MSFFPLFPRLPHTYGYTDKYTCFAPQGDTHVDSHSIHTQDINKQKDIYTDIYNCGIETLADPYIATNIHTHIKIHM